MSVHTSVHVGSEDRTWELVLSLGHVTQVIGRGGQCVSADPSGLRYFTLFLYVSTLCFYSRIPEVST